MVFHRREMEARRELGNKAVEKLRGLAFVPSKAGPSLGDIRGDHDHRPTLRVSAKEPVARIDPDPFVMLCGEVATTDEPVITKILDGDRLALGTFSHPIIM